MESVASETLVIEAGTQEATKTAAEAATTTTRRRKKKKTRATRASIGGGCLGGERLDARGGECLQVFRRRRANGWDPASRRFSAEPSEISSASVMIRLEHAWSQVDRIESERLCPAAGGSIDGITRCASDLSLSGAQTCHSSECLDRNDAKRKKRLESGRSMQRLASGSGCNSFDSIQADVPLTQDTRESDAGERSPDASSPVHRVLERAATCCSLRRRADLLTVDSASVSEKLQQQEAQRKHVILSMAMERLTAKRDATSGSNETGPETRIASDIINGENQAKTPRDKSCQPTSRSTTSCQLEATLRPPSRRSNSAVCRTNINCDSLSQSAANKCDTHLETLIVESWLDDHPEFVRDYLLRKAPRHLIDDWLIANARVSSTNLKGSLLDISSTCSSSSRPNSQLSLNLRRPVWVGLATNREEAEPEVVGSLRSSRSNSQSAAMTMREGNSTTPMRKISATDFEMRSGGGFLRPMLSKTPDGRCSFLPLIQSNCRRQSNQTPVKRLDDVNQSSGTSSTSTLEHQRGSASALNEAQGRDRRESADANPAAADGEVRLIFELVKNICDDLDIRTLLYKILKNIAALINADRSSLFLVCGGPNDPNRRLVSQLFNVDQESSCELDEVDEPITIPWGTGLVGYVAASGESVNIADCYGDPRFTDAIDQRTGYITQHMLCAPIFDKNMEIVGVAQVINKRDGNPFSASDETKFKRYLQFCGIGLRNAQSYERCQLENKRNQVLLDLARMVFEEQSGIEQVVHRIMLHTQSLLDCERCQVLLIDNVQHELDHLVQFPPARSQIQSSDGDQCEGKLVEAPGRGDVLPRDHWQPQCSPRGEIASAPDAGSCQLSAGEEMESRTPEVGQHQAGTAPARLFSLVFDLECDAKTSDDPVIYDHRDQSASGQRRAFPINIGITSFVASTGETLNIEDAHKHARFDASVDEGTDFRHRSILCMPIRNGQRQIIGVIQLINKRNGQPFNKNDEDLFEAFAIFCGLGIHNALMYEQVLKVMAKQRVTFEVLSYHATAPLEEAKRLSQEQIPSCFALNLSSLKFNDFSLDEQYMLKSCTRFFLDLDLMRRFQIDQLVFCNWILSVQKNYRKVTYHPIVGGDGLKASPVRYHNWRHAFNVSQMMFAILMNTQICESLGELETLALLIACLCHDLDHRGTNNSFQIKSASPLAELYSTSTMEHHHFDQCVMILNSQGNQILSNLSPQEYSRVIVLLEEAILATDLANYFSKRDLFFQLINSDQLDWRRNQQHRSLLRCMLMTACDIAAITKPWPVQKVVADLVMSEFYQQGDIERDELKIEPIDMMNRDKMSQLPDMQIGFIDSICAPIYTAFARLFPHELEPLIDGCLSNRSLWCELAQNVQAAATISNSNYTVCDNNGPSKHDDERASNLLTVSDLCISKSAISLRGFGLIDEAQASVEELVENKTVANEGPIDCNIASQDPDAHGEPTILDKLTLSGIDKRLADTGLASSGSIHKQHRCDTKRRSI